MRPTLSLPVLGCLSGLFLLNLDRAGAASYSDAVLADGPIAYYRFNDVPPVATNSGSLGATANGTYNGNATAGAEAPRPPAFIGFEADNTALQLDGSGDFVGTVSGLLNGKVNVTATGWLRRNGVQNNRTGLWGQNDLIEFGYIDNNTLQLWVDNFSAPVDVTPNPFPDAQWSYVAFTLNGTQMKVYTNGLLAGTTALPSASYGTTTFGFNIGGGGVFDDPTVNGNFFNGQIDEVAVFDKTLTAEQIAAHYYSTVASPPIITRQPQSTNVFEGADVILSVEAVGTAPFSYQWFDFGVLIPNETNATLVFSNITIAQGNSYSVEVSNPFGTVLSDHVDVIVAATEPPTITQQPGSITRYTGATATLSVVATGGSRLQYQWQCLFCGEPNIPGATNAPLVFGNVQAGQAGDYRVIVANSAGSTTSAVATLTVIAAAPGSYEESIVSLGPMAYWRLNETNGSTAFDYVGGNDARYVNPGGIPGTPPTGAEAPRGPQFPGFEANNLAGQFDGATVYVTGPNGLLNTVNSFAVVGWIRRGGAQANRTGLFGQNDLVEFGYINDNMLQLWTDAGLDISPNPFPNGEWAHVAVVGASSPGTALIYTNGVVAGTRSHLLPGPTSFPFNIGGGGVFDGSGNFFNGQIDEVAVFNKALSSEEICRLYLRATGDPVSLSINVGGNIVADSKPSGTAHDGANFGADWAATSIDANFVTRTGVMQFVATELDQITLAPDPDFNSTNGTIMFWMRSAGTTGGGNDGAILVDRRSSRGDVIVQWDDGTIFVQANDGAGTVNQFNTTGTVNNDWWHHIAYVYDQTTNGTTTIYLDGVQVGSQAPTRNWSWDPAQRIELGRSHDPYWRAFNGAMDDFRIYDRILTGAEVAQIASSGDLVDTAALKVRLNFDGPTTGITITWLCGTLQRADTFVGNGPGTLWTDVPGAASPYVVNPLTATNRFYRVKY